MLWRRLSSNNSLQASSPTMEYHPIRLGSPNKRTLIYGKAISTNRRKVLVFSSRLDLGCGDLFPCVYDGVASAAISNGQPGDRSNNVYGNTVCRRRVHVFIYNQAVTGMPLISSGDYVDYDTNKKKNTRL